MKADDDHHFIVATVQNRVAELFAGEYRGDFEGGKIIPQRGSSLSG